MKIHPAIAALRSDPASQRRIKAQMRSSQSDWLKRPQIRAVASELAQFAKGVPLAKLGVLNQAMSDLDTARALIAGFCEDFTRALKIEALGEVPLRHSSSEGFGRLQLLQSGGAVLSACTYEPQKNVHEPTVVQFVDCALHEIVIAGSARGCIYRESGGEIQTEPSLWTAGSAISLKPRSEARKFIAVDRSALVLQLSRTPQHPMPSRELRLADCELIRETSGDRKASEQVMALGVLGALGLTETIVPMRDFARDTARDATARWEALRQVLAMECATGFALLDELAARSEDPLSFPAAQLRDQLIAREPRLRELAEAGLS